MKTPRLKEKTLRLLAPFFPVMLCLWVFLTSGFVLPQSQLASYWFANTDPMTVTLLQLAPAKLSFYLPFMAILYLLFWLILSLQGRLLQYFHRQTVLFYAVSGAILSVALYLSLSIVQHSRPSFLVTVLVITTGIISSVPFSSPTKKK